MKFSTALKKLEKIGEVKNSSVFYWVTIGRNRLTFIDNGGTQESAICFHTDRLDKSGEKTHTTYWDNMTQMIKYS